MTCNAQDLINISRKRLCAKSSIETRNAWKMVVDEIRLIDSCMANSMVAECVYRGFCPESNSCGYSKTKTFEAEIKYYRMV
jgi:hypothetical protein